MPNRHCQRLLILWFFFLLFEHCACQSGGKNNPPLEDIAKFKQATTSPAKKTCGYPDRSDFCAPVDSADGLVGQACSIKTCNQECPGRDRDNDPGPGDPRRFIDMLSGDPGTCVSPDNKDIKIPEVPSFIFYNDPQCGMSPPTAPRMGRKGQFALTAWLKQSRRNAGVIFEKIAGRARRKQVVLIVMISAFSIAVQYRGADGRPNYKIIQAQFPSDEWHHLTIQVYDRDISFFIDGPEADGTPFAAEKLAVPMVDLTTGPMIRVGQRLSEWNETTGLAFEMEKEFPEWSTNSTGQYVGRMQQFRWYDKMLTNREIQEIVTGTFPEIYIQSHCLCPEGFPRVHPVEERFCIPNGVPDTDVNSRRLRLDPDAHPLDYINDGDSSTTWVSSDDLYMPGGLTITIDLENGEYQIFYVILHFYSAQPRSITISRFSNGTDGEYEPWGYFADDCVMLFKYPNNGPLPSPSAVNCQQFPPNDQIPYRDGNVTLSLLPEKPHPRPGSDDLYGTPELLSFIKATKVQLRFQYQYFTGEEFVNLRHQYYGLRSVQVIGRCDCNGYASSCNMETNPYQCDCFESSNTAGHMCEECKPLYNNKPYRIGEKNSAQSCQKCNCHQHADSCHYERERDAYPDDKIAGGGGVCDDCKHHTTGLHCEQCEKLFFRRPEKDLDAIDACTPCSCRLAGVVNGTKDCERIGGQCQCKSKVTSRRCDTCVDGYYNLRKDNDDGCQECLCTLSGTVNRTFTCNQNTGQCYCRRNVDGRECNICKRGFKYLDDANLDGCEVCNCNEIGSQDQYCHPVSGQCYCRKFVQGLLCNECENGFWNLSLNGCQPCGCDPAGTEPGTICDKVSGQCVCKANTQGRTCNVCDDNYYNLTAWNKQGCESCNCDSRGTINGSLVCDKEIGTCSCKEKVKGRVCNLCRGNTFGLRAELDTGCEPCNCDPKGTALGGQLAPHELVCDSNSGQCACLPSREGRRCDQCSPGFYLPAKNESGCLMCDCHPVGSTSQVCNNVTGKCPCKPSEAKAGLTGRRCDQCAPTFWDFHPLFGLCKECGCISAGSKSAECNIITGQCECKENVISKQCDTCRPGSSHLNKDNPMGCYSHPEQQAAPSEEQVRTRRILLQWSPPDHPNGDKLTYQLYRNKELVLTRNDSIPFSVSYQFNDSGLLPYTTYDYYIETSNVGGRVLSPELRVQTLAGIPTGIPPLTVTNVLAHEASFAWTEPEVAHGPIVTYVLQSVTSAVDNVVEVHYRGLSTAVTATDLTAFTNYTFTLRACTSGGCGNSLPLIVITPEDKPRRQRPPTLIPLSNTSLQVSWDPPDEPNGVIIQYEVMMRGKPGADGVNRPLQRVVFRDSGAFNPRPASDHQSTALDPPGTNFTQVDLQPFTQYEFLVSSANSRGTVQSSWATARTLEGTPVFMNPPVLTPISSFEVDILWKAPHPVTEARGDVVMYQVILTRNNTSGNPFAPPLEDAVIYSSGPAIQHFLAAGFQPYSTHSIKMKLCNSVSCILSDPRNVTTMPAAPSGQSPPIPNDRSETFIDFVWSDPEKVNGPRPSFAVLRSRVAFAQPPIEMSRGVRFPGKSYVRFPPAVLPRDASYSGIQLRFRTFEEDALLLFAAASLSAKGDREEYQVLQLKGGRPWYLFDAQNNPTAVTLQNGSLTFNDGEWHRIEVNRFERDAYIELDGTHTGSARSSRETTVIGTNDGVLVGGLPGDYRVGRSKDRGEQVAVTHGLIGCIKDIRVQRDGSLAQWSNVTWEEADQWHRAYDSWQGCPVMLDRPGVHFLGRGYLTMSKKLGALDPTVWSVEVDFRTEFSSGVLFYASGRRGDFMLATIQQRKLRYLVSTARDGVIESNLDFKNLTINVCDGEWHTILFQNKRGFLSIQLDDFASVYETAFTFSGQTGAFDLSRELFVGGLPLSKLNDMVTLLDEDSRGFGGCMRHVSVNREAISLLHDVETALNVDLDGCPKGASQKLEADDLSGEGSGMLDPFPTAAIQQSPTMSRNVTKCFDASIQVLYRGMGHSYSDDSIGEEFTRYLYKVTSSNAGGEAPSEWIIARSGEGIPETIPAPFNERSHRGTQITVEWRRALRANGVISNYTLTAIALDRLDRASEDLIEGDRSRVINSTFKGDVFIGNISELTPWTNYSIYVTACTVRGCARSAGDIMTQTAEEIPDGVYAPTADVTAHNMIIRWRTPRMQNGRIIRYVLFHNRSRIYSGLEKSFEIPGLPIFTAQKFQLEVCTSTGCNVSDYVTLYSGQLPPSHVDQPMVTVLGSHSVEVRWLEPAMLNGVFDRYVLYLRNESNAGASSGTVVYNSTSRLLDRRLNDLVAGTQYYVTLVTCTGGGCTFSSATPCQTTESIPEDVLSPEAVPLSPHSFHVTWLPPRFPNGEITLYSIYQNDALILNSTKPSSTVVTGMTPWSRHIFRVRACTKKGCSFGPSKALRTQQSPPEGRVQLAVTVLSPRSLEAKWDKPDRQNGKMHYVIVCTGLFYVNPEQNDYRTVRESRNKLNTSETEKWQRVHGLIPHLEYIIKINASNSAGYIISNMRSVTMPPGSPDGVMAPTLYAQSPYSILASWKDPARNNAPGNSTFQLQYRSVTFAQNEKDLLHGVTREMSFELSGLLPYKEYEFRTIASNAYGSTASEWASIFTLQARPSNLDPPIIYDITAWSLRVTWEPPSEPNGILETYRLYENGELRAELPGNITSYRAESLTPYTTYTYKIEACTEAGCTPSVDSNRIITSPAPPQALDPPVVRSNSPLSVTISWKPPRISNGVLDNYVLERRLGGNQTVDDSDIDVLGGFVPSQALRFLDESSDLKPYTSYQYRVISSTLAGGTTPSNWSTVRTRPGRPGLVFAPAVTVLGPESASVEWQKPMRPNGPIIRYEIAFPDPRIVVANLSETIRNVTGLIPFTDYEVSVVACTSSGCTESPTTSVQTLTAVPRGLDPPILTPISERFVNVQWRPPKYPNGPDIHYELSRTIIRQPLLLNVPSYINISENVYTGTELFFEDKDLEMYTTCRYRVSVFNTEGSLASDESEVTTMAGYPISPGVLNVAVHNHTAVYLWWQPPSIKNLQGEVHYYYISYSSTNAAGDIEKFGPEGTAWKLGSLRPSTTYTFYLLVDNGSHNVTSEGINATTDDGAPIGLSKPVVYSKSPSQLRVSWLAPTQPNGRITAYNVILDDKKIVTNLTEPSSYIISDLRPYTVYTLKMEACTLYACAMSNATQATTLETNPTGISPPLLRTSSATTVEVNWEAAKQPNGILRSYHVQRRSLLSCRQIPKLPEEKCQYVKCSRGNRVCASTCYAPTEQVCCDGILYDVHSKKECCGAKHVPLRKRPNDVCCGGRFHSWREGHKCCVDRYLKVEKDQICCRDPVEDRVSVGVGDSCCGGIPYFNNSLQICCNTQLHDAFGHRCCGGEVISQKQQCCGDNQKGVVFEPTPGKMCCGMQYVFTNSTLCCNDPHRNEVKVHLVEYGEVANGSLQCCSTNLIPKQSSCCHGNAYDPTKEVCADAATLSLGDTSMPPSCGDGTVCPLQRATFASCDRCDFDSEYYDCFRAKPKSSLVSHYLDDDVCPTLYVTIYTGPPHVFSFVDDGLEAFTKYQYQVIAENIAGKGESHASEVMTPQAPPDHVKAPEWVSSDRDTILLTWKPPEKANGIITHYALSRDGLEIWSGNALRHTDSTGILSYKEYAYVLKVCTSAGCTSSKPVRATSTQGIPEHIAPPRLLVTSSSNIFITWLPPVRSNGFIQKYMLNETDAGTLFVLSPTTTEPGDLKYEHINLKPHTTYTYAVTACTSVGCTDSDEVSAQTNEAPPSGVWINPVTLVINSTTVELYWRKPQEPNGVIREYRLFRSVVVDQGDLTLSNGERMSTWRLVHIGGPDTLTFTDTVDQPGATLVYKLSAYNGVGYGISSEHRVELPKMVPSVTSDVTVQVVSPTTIRAEWNLTSSEGTYPDGSNYFYEIVLQRLRPGTRHSLSTTTVSTPSRQRREISSGPSSDDTPDTITLIPVGQRQEHLIEGLTPSTTYSVRIRTCINASTANLTNDQYNTSESCNVGSPSLSSTPTAPPEGQAAPKLKSLGPRSVRIRWSAPESPNGVIARYRVYRRLGSPRATVKYEELIFESETPDVLSYVDSSGQLRPYTTYQYQVKVSNTKGEASSPWSNITTHQDVPTGIESPTLEAVSAFAVRTEWRAPQESNGLLTSYRLEYQKISLDPTVVPAIMTAITAPASVTQATFSGLDAYTTYRVRVVAVNQAMLEGRSAWTQVTTLSAPPSEVANLTAEMVPDGRSMLLTWEEPTIPNGKISTYNLYEVGFEDTPVYTGQARRFVFRRLTPYTKYTLILEACTGQNLCTRSKRMRFQTAETVPEMQAPPVVRFSNASTVMVSWFKPSRPNGRITSYQVERRVIPRWMVQDQSQHLRRQRSITLQDLSYDVWLDEGSKLSWNPDQFQLDPIVFYNEVPTKRKRRQISANNWNDEDTGEVIYAVSDPANNFYNYSDSAVEPFTAYEYRIRTSTNAGSVRSDWVSTETHQAPPEGLAAPKVFHPDDKNPTSLVVTWKLPERLNGELQTFRIQRNSTTPLSFPIDRFRFTDNNLQPYTIYSYTVSACTAGGCLTSDTTTLRTYEEAPLFVAPPAVDPLNSTAIKTSWEKPQIANGIINLYRLLVDEVVRFEGMEMTTVVTSLEPYKNYYISLEACTNSGCRRSSKVGVRTLEAPPAGLDAPELHVTSPNSIEVVWQQPRYPNGEIVRYEVRRNGELVNVDDGRETRYHDFSLSAGTKYEYKITAYNKKGKVESEPPVFATTDPSSPSGLSPPSLQATSSSSIRAEWELPANPNGVIVNYTLYIRHVTSRDQKAPHDFSGNVFSFEVRGLRFFEEYIFWLRACTEQGCVMSERAQQRTMEASPANQLRPAVVLPYPDQIALDISWQPPRDQNGVIKGYRLYRRKILSTPRADEKLSAQLIRNLTEHSYTDFDLHPYTQYEYKVVSFNPAGEASSDWSSSVRSGESAPEGVPEPIFHDITSYSIRVTAGTPELANGHIRFYNVFMRKNGTKDQFIKASSGPGSDQTIINLRPYTSYEFLVEVCTLESLCTKGISGVATTLPAPPNGQNPPQVHGVEPNNLTLTWSEPSQANGKIIRYELHVRRSCPLTHQPFAEECLLGFPQLDYSGPSHSKVVRNLQPYTRYAFKVTSYNEYGSSGSEWENAVTAKRRPIYVAPFTATSNISAIAIHWPNSFKLNSVLLRYELTDSSEIVYSGSDSFYMLRRTATLVHRFRVTAHTDTGSTETPILRYDTKRRGSEGEILVFSVDEEPTEGSGDEVVNVAMPIYQNTWFIIAAVIVVMTLLFVGVALSLRRKRVPERQRTPLKTPPPFGLREPTSGGVLMSSLGPYRSSDYTDRSLSVRARGTATRRGPSSDDGYLHRSNSHLIDQDMSFDHSIFDDQRVIEYDDQWESVYDDDLAYVSQPTRGEKIVGTTVDSGVISNVSNKRVGFANYRVDRVRLPEPRPYARKRRADKLRQHMSRIYRDTDYAVSYDDDGNHAIADKSTALPVDVPRVGRSHLRKRQDNRQPVTFYYHQDGPYTVI